MGIIWIDPGHNFTGIARLDDDGYGFEAHQFEDPVEGYDWLTGKHQCADYVGIEDFTHGGAFTREAKTTLMVLGFFQHAYRYDYNKPMAVHSKSTRLAFVSYADRMISRKYKDLITVGGWVAVKDASAALAHCLAAHHNRSL